MSKGFKCSSPLYENPFTKNSNKKIQNLNFIKTWDDFIFRKKTFCMLLQEKQYKFHFYTTKSCRVIIISILWIFVVFGIMRKMKF